MNTAVTIRPVHPDDAEVLYEIVSHPAVAATLLSEPTMEITETREWIKKPKPGQHRLVATVDDVRYARGRPVASGSIVQAQNPRAAHSGRLGLMVHPDYWNQGVGTQLMAALLDLSDNWLNLMRVQLEVFPHNEAAVHLYRKFDFEEEGTRRMVAYGDGGWLDDMVMARLRRSASLPSTIDRSRLWPDESASAAPLNPNDVKIRTVRPGDAHHLWELYRHPAVARTTMQLPSQEISKSKERLETREKSIHRLVAIVRGKAVGSITLRVHQRPRMAHGANLGMGIHPVYWGQGIGTRLMESIVDVADNWLNLRRVDLQVNTDNPAGIRLYEKFDFEIEGTHEMHVYGDGRFADSYFMARVRDA